MIRKFNQGQQLAEKSKKIIGKGKQFKEKGTDFTEECTNVHNMEVLRAFASFSIAALNSSKKIIVFSKTGYELPLGVGMLRGRGIP